MATLDDLKVVLESIDRSMTDQKTLLTNMFNLQQTQNRLSSVNTSVIQQTPMGESIGAAAAGIGSGVGSAATGLGIGGLLGLGALSIFTSLDADTIKKNVVTLLSIADEVGGRAEMLKESGSFFLAMSGLGIGLAAFGVGQAITGLGQWITDDQWTETLKNNVVDLLSIADEVGGNLSILYKGGTVGLALGGLGAGLAAFGVGQSLTGIAQWVTDNDWAEQVKSNVLTLLSIGEEIPENANELNEAGTFFFAMTGLSAGLAVFSVGQAATGLAQFISNDDWAEQVKSNVSTLLSISELPGIGWNTAGFIGVMTGLVTGLAIFALGKGGTVIVDGASEALGYFTGASFADKIKSEVQTLLSIPQMEGVGADTTKFIGVMTGLVTGLAIFALGKGGTVIVDGASEALDYFTGDEPFADKIKSEVETLLSIVSLAPKGSVDEFNRIMTSLGNGLSSFAGGSFVGTLKNAGAAILGFFGVNSPFDQIMTIADKADDLIKGADALDKIAEALNKFGAINIDVGSIDFKKLAENLGKAVPLLDALANGGPVAGSGSWLSSPLVFSKGILDPSLRLDEMADAISKVNYVLGQTTEYPISLRNSAIDATAESPIISDAVERIRAEREAESARNFQTRAEIVSSTGSAVGTQVNAVDNSVKTDARSTVVGGATIINNFNSKRMEDLDYGLGGLRVAN